MRAFKVERDRDLTCKETRRYTLISAHMVAVRRLLLHHRQIALAIRVGARIGQIVLLHGVVAHGER